MLQVARISATLTPVRGAISSQLLLRLPIPRGPPHPSVAKQHIDDDDAQRRHDPLKVHHFFGFHSLPIDVRTITERGQHLRWPLWQAQAKTYPGPVMRLYECGLTCCSVFG